MNGKQVNDALTEAMKKSFGEYPDKRLNKNDAGSLPITIHTEDGRVILTFAKPVGWVGFTANEAISLAELITNHARNILNRGEK